MVTGRTPGNHGIYDFIKSEEGPEGLYFTLNTSDDIRCETIWSTVSRQGGTVSCLNFPVSYPPFQVNGQVVPGLISWKHLRRSVYPAEFYDTMRGIPGFDARALTVDANEEFKSIQWLPHDEYEGWIVQHIRREKQWFSLVRNVLEKDPPDLMGVIFDGVDKIQHLCWRFLDPALIPRNPTVWEGKIRERCLEYFRTVDEFIRDIVELAGADARIFITSDHGFGPTKDVFYANVWLERQGLLSWANTTSKDEVGMLGTGNLKNHVVGIDWGKTVAHALSPSSNGIYIRRAQKNGQAGIHDSEYDTFRQQLANKLTSVTHPHTGKPIVKKVMTREEAFPGTESYRAPDLTLVLEDHGFISVLNADSAVKTRQEVAGTHRPDGIFIACGTGIVSGHCLDPLQIVDVAPTLLYSLETTIPTDLEGHVIEGCFEASFLAGHPRLFSPRIAGFSKQTTSATSAYGRDEDENEIIDRLKALGYIE
jgi:predicted AlkP superfamily phosphohydrolase/phosphomutase